MPKSLKKFPVQSQAEWVEHFYREVGNTATPRREWEGLSLRKFYAFDGREESVKLPVLKGSLDNGTIQPRSWHNIVAIDELKPGNANSEALNDLMRGADGLLFRSVVAEDLKVILQDILPDFASLCFTGVSWDAQSTFREWLDDHDVVRKNVRGYLIAEQPESEKDTWRLFKEYPALRCLSLTMKSPPEGEWIEHLISLLREADMLFDRLTEEGLSAEVIWGRLVVITTLGPLFFEEIARLKVIRLLLYKIARAYGAGDISPDGLLLHATTPAEIQEAYEPRSTMISSVTAALAAIMGGAGMITVVPADTAGQVDKRIARNVCLVLREESFLGQVNDPLGGAYYVDELIALMGRKAWNIFRQSRLQPS